GLVFYCACVPQELPAFPTRRSSDLPAQVSIEEESFEQGDALRDEIAAFLHAIRTGTEPLVTGEDGLRALETAMRITELVQRSSRDRKSTRLNSSHVKISYAVFCLKK